jgi:hypothetical protein
MRLLTRALCIVGGWRWVNPRLHHATELCDCEPCRAAAARFVAITEVVIMRLANPIGVKTAGAFRVGGTVPAQPALSRLASDVNL